MSNPAEVNEIPVHTVINNFTLQILFDEGLWKCLKNTLIKDTFQALIKDGGTFNMIREALAILKTAHGAANASDDELRPAVCSHIKL